MRGLQRAAARAAAAAGAVLAAAGRVLVAAGGGVVGLGLAKGVVVAVEEAAHLRRVLRAGEGVLALERGGHAAAAAAAAVAGRRAVEGAAERVVEAAGGGVGLGLGRRAVVQLLLVNVVGKVRALFAQEGRERAKGVAAARVVHGALAVRPGNLPVALDVGENVEAVRVDGLGDNVAQVAVHLAPRRRAQAVAVGWEGEIQEQRHEL